MVLMEVARHVLSGCFLKSSDPYDHRVFRRMLRWEESLLDRYPPESHEGIMLRAGHLRVGDRLHHWSPVVARIADEAAALQFDEAGALADLAAVAPVEHHAEERTLIRFVGWALRKSFRRLLTRSMRRYWADFWPISFAEGQQYYAREIAKTFSGGRRLGHQALDLLDQPLRRCLPRYCSLVDTGKQFPNCTGKALLLAAFSDLARIPTAAVTPLMTSSEYYRCQYAGAAIMFLQRLQEKLPMSDERIASFDEVVYDFYQHMSLPSYQHTAMIWRLDDGSILLMDPNFDVVRVLEENIDTQLALLKKYRGVLPGLSLQGFGFLDRNTFKPYLLDFDKAIAHAEDLLLKVEKLEDVRGLALWLSRSPILDAVLSWRMFKDHMPPGMTRYHQAAMLLYDFSHLEEESVMNWSARKILGRLSTEEAWEGLHDLLYRYVTWNLKLVDRTWKILNGAGEVKTIETDLNEKSEIVPPNTCVERWQGTMAHRSESLGVCHPMMEIHADLDHALGSVVLAHAGMEMGVSADVERVLAEQSFEQYRIFYHALTAKGPTSLEMFALLKRLPFRLRSVEVVLEDRFPETLNPVPERDTDGEQASAA